MVDLRGLPTRKAIASSYTSRRASEAVAGQLRRTQSQIRSGWRLVDVISSYTQICGHPVHRKPLRLGDCPVRFRSASACSFGSGRSRNWSSQYRAEWCAIGDQCHHFFICGEQYGLQNVSPADLFRRISVFGFHPCLSVSIGG